MQKGAGGGGEPRGGIGKKGETEGTKVQASNTLCQLQTEKQGLVGKN